jgi:hypothetical protein
MSKLDSNLEFYIKQSGFSDPKEYGFLYDNLPTEPKEIFSIVRNLLLHMRDGELFNYRIPPKRFEEVEYRYINKILGNIIKKDDRLISKPRLIQKKAIGTCRDFSLLACSMLRHVGVPSRIRFGFNTYYYRLFFHDIVLLEYWDFSSARWRFVDVRTTDVQVKGHKFFNVDFDLCDIPCDRFILAGEAWGKCKNAKMNCKQFGHDPVKKINGLWYIRNKIMQDLAALNKTELLMWDCWGYMRQTENDADLYDTEQSKVIDQVAEVVRDQKINLNDVRKLYANSDLKMLGIVKAMSPISGWHEVKIC